MDRSAWERVERMLEYKTRMARFWQGLGITAMVTAAVLVVATRGATTIQAQERPASDKRNALVKVGAYCFDLNNIQSISDLKDDPDPQYQGQIMISFNGGGEWSYLYLKDQEADTIRQWTKEHVPELAKPTKAAKE